MIPDPGEIWSVTQGPPGGRGLRRPCLPPAPSHQAPGNVVPQSVATGGLPGHTEGTALPAPNRHLPPLTEEFVHGLPGAPWSLPPACLMEGEAKA